MINGHYSEYSTEEISHGVFSTIKIDIFQQLRLKNTRFRHFFRNSFNQVKNGHDFEYSTEEIGRGVISTIKIDIFQRLRPKNTRFRHFFRK